MYPLPLISFLFFAFFATASSSLPPDGNLSGCHESSSRGSITNIDFPFTGGRRPHYCGSPGFNLTCLDNSTALLTINFLEYRILHIDESRPDLHDTAGCTRDVQNATLASSNFTAAKTENLTLFYNCNYTSLPGVSSMLRSRCNTSFTAPISDVYAGVMANGSLLGPALRDGFEINYADSGNAICICAIGSVKMINHADFQLESIRDSVLCLYTLFPSGFRRPN
ncbi:unnamed protein product [Linum trigynum]|uniref:Wall-associated receptor kinase galacturonan-binding domain-containing protein n=1 Tax=Linum trigynum TaxID=586398 RepID=A0AAV2CYS4_9ROSI